MIINVVWVTSMTVNVGLGYIDDHQCGFGATSMTVDVVLSYIDVHQCGFEVTSMTINVIFGMKKEL